MPKKFQGENTKAVIARARKQEKAATEKAIKEKQAEDEYWRDDDKNIGKKLQRKEKKDKKKLESMEKKLERKRLEEIENAENEPKSNPVKVTQFQIQKRKEEETRLSQAKESQEMRGHAGEIIHENLNRSNVETVEASGIDAAISALSVNADGTPDRHPEKRMAAAFRAFESERLPVLKKENPSMRLSQLKQALRKEWQKHPSNPLNQRVVSS